MREPERDSGRLQDIIQAANYIAAYMLSLEEKMNNQS